MDGKVCGSINGKYLHIAEGLVVGRIWLCKKFGLTQTVCDSDYHFHKFRDHPENVFYYFKWSDNGLRKAILRAVNEKIGIENRITVRASLAGTMLDDIKESRRVEQKSLKEIPNE